jgi:hypothetical protein
MDEIQQRSYTKTECIVAVVDLLDQRRQILAIASAENDGQQREAFNNTIQRMDRVRSVAQAAIRQSSQPASRDDLAQLSDGSRAVYESFMQDVQLGMFSFSDTTTFYLRLDQKTNRARLEETVELAAMFSMFFVAGVLLFDCLANEIPIRGALAHGITYIAEEYCAQYPRIVIAPHLIRRLRDVASSKRDAVVAAQQCLALLHQDYDGFYAVDFLSGPFREISADFWSKAEKAKTFVLAEHGKFVAKGDLKLAPRYFRLASYFLHRLP